MTLEKTIALIDSLQHLIGQKVPKWDSPVFEMIPAPTNETFFRYMEIFEETGDITNAIKIARSMDFDVLLIFRTTKLHGNLVYEWYSFFYPEINQ
jgi:hypothetical protein